VAALTGRAWPGAACGHTGRCTMSGTQGQSVGKDSAGNKGVLAHLIEVIAKSLVDFPDKVFVNEVVGENTTVIELKVAKEDIGKIIGKQGRTAQAVRTVLNGASTKLRKRTVLEIVE
jgi:predicted RNA-binding protein YlqC (UPF0109 family)